MEREKQENIDLTQRYLGTLQEIADLKRKLETAQNKRKNFLQSNPWLEEIEGKIEANTPTGLKRRREQKEEDKRKQAEAKAKKEADNQM